MFTTTGPHDARNRGLATGRELPVVLGPALRRETRPPPSPRVPGLVSGEKGNVNCITRIISYKKRCFFPTSDVP